MNTTSLPQNRRDLIGNAKVLFRNLSANAAQCARHNIEVQVQAINHDRTVAICSVRQKTTGLLRRTCSQDELVWRAEQALAPLHKIGILPLINVCMPEKPADGAAAHNGTPPALLERLRSWWGYPSADGHGQQTGSDDPFGLHAALRQAEQ